MSFSISTSHRNKQNNYLCKKSRHWYVPRNVGEFRLNTAIGTMEHLSAHRLTPCALGWVQDGD